VSPTASRGGSEARVWAATLDEVLAACQKVEKGNDKNGCPNGWAVLAVQVDDCPGIASSDRLINYIKAGIETQYKVIYLSSGIGACRWGGRRAEQR
jgi:hypothetical protein